MTKRIVYKKMNPVNQNRKIWNDKYVTLRRLCILRGLKIVQYTGSSNSYENTRFGYGDIIIKKNFWDALKPAYKAQISAMNNKIAKLFEDLATELSALEPSLF